MIKTLSLLFVTIYLNSTITAHAASWIRYNEAGYSPDQQKVFIVMSEDELLGSKWQVFDSKTDSSILSGFIGVNICGVTEHTPMPYNYEVDLSTLKDQGSYQLRISDGEGISFKIEENPYLKLLNLPLRHLRIMRSGSDHTLIRNNSHPGDQSTPVWIPEGDIGEGRWIIDPNGKKVDVMGGWYDAGDQIKFTLNIAYTTYHLLLAYEQDPELFPRIYNQANTLPDILDEALHGLNYLLKTHPQPDLFIIQVGDEKDHDQGLRLPKDDKLDGQRPALCALSRVHMASATAALALGAQIWRDLGEDEISQNLTDHAICIFTRSLQPDTVMPAFERGQVNDFYRDTTEDDQMALAATELYELTGEKYWLTLAIKHSPAPGYEVSWGNWHWLANAQLAVFHPEAKQKLKAEAMHFTEYGEKKGQPWNIPGRYVWGSIHRWVGAANATQYYSSIFAERKDYHPLFADMLDYVFGKNPWGVSFLFSKELKNSVQEIYSPLYHILGEFPTGALSEGPGNRSTHDQMLPYFLSAREWEQKENHSRLNTEVSTSTIDKLQKFNTQAAVFSDNRFDFMCQESTITGQADIILMLTLAI